MLDELQSAEDRATAAEAEARTAGYRIRQLTGLMEQRGQSPDVEIRLPEAWSEFPDWYDQNLVGRVSLLPRARKEVRAPRYEDIKTAARCLLWLAGPYRTRRLAGGEGALQGPVESGIQNERCGSDCFTVNWHGRQTEVDWQVKNGGNTRAPQRCLRIYYFWDDPGQQVVVASMPAHLPTDAS